MESIHQVKGKVISTVNYHDQLAGTSGLRKKAKVFIELEHYLENFVQSIFNSHKEEEYKGKSLIVGGDGRYFNDVAIRKIVKICAGNGIATVLIAEGGILSTPAASLQVRNTENCFGAIILTASHNPGGLTEDFGIKFNGNTGAPAQELVTQSMHDHTKTMKSYLTIDLAEEQIHLLEGISAKVDGEDFCTKIFSSTDLYVQTMRKLFDFESIDTLFKRKDFTFVFDAMHGAAGPYAIEIFHKIFGVDMKNLHNCNILDDFGGLHPDPNLVYAKNLVSIMNIHKLNSSSIEVPEFGAACDGDADRNMILGKEFFISPSDSIAIISANYKLIKYLQSGITGLARSMPTSSALDLVAKKLNVNIYEVPTGWKFFGNLMDAGLIQLCGEESFGTGSNHIREKDGIWAILCWLSILAEKNKSSDELVTVRDVVVNHWKEYGRHYYCRFDYESIAVDVASKVISTIESNFEYFNSLEDGNKAHIFEYHDCVDGSVSKNQGWIFALSNGSRIVFRTSGTSSSGATIRIYFEKYVDQKGELLGDNLEIIKANEGGNLVELAVKLSNIHEITERDGPTVIT